MSRQRNGCLVLLIVLPLALRVLTAQQVNVNSELPEAVTDETKVPPPSSYGGAAACARCHAQVATAYAVTPHSLDTSLPSANTVVGDFSREKAVLRTRNPNLAFAMVAAPDGPR